jgi:cytidine deaminase
MDSFADLIRQALAAREKAYVPYSGFAVGAVLQDTDGRTFCGCNVENGSFGLTICAERSAVFAAVIGGAASFKRLVLVSDVPAYLSPCGACRQVLREFTDTLEIISVNLNGESKTWSIRDLLPDTLDEITRQSFSRSDGSLSTKGPP